LQIIRGAIVLTTEHALIIWHYLPNGDPLGLPVAPQTGPRHRSHVPLSPDEARTLGLRPLASIVKTADPMIELAELPVRILAVAPATLVLRIADTIRRSRFANIFERAMSPDVRPWL
jgi:hypothetical protein